MSENFPVSVQGHNIMPNKIYIDKCIEATTIQKLWKPKDDDLILYFFDSFRGSEETCIRVDFECGHFAELLETQGRESFIFLPNIEWLWVEIKKNMGGFGNIEVVEQFQWTVIKLRRTMGYKEFSAYNLKTCCLICVEWLLSKGKNDLGKTIKAIKDAE